MFDQQARPIAGWLERYYFSRWSRSRWNTAVDGIVITNDVCMTEIQVDQEHRRCDGVVIGGDLVPNSELIVAADLAVSQPRRIPARLGRNELSGPDWFIAGVGRGGFHAAAWCYQDGRCAGSSVATYLREVCHRGAVDVRHSPKVGSVSPADLGR